MISPKSTRGLDFIYLRVHSTSNLKSVCFLVHNEVTDGCLIIFLSLADPLLSTPVLCVILLWQFQVKHPHGLMFSKHVPI